MSLIYLSCAWLAGIFIGTIFEVPPVFLVLSLIPLSLLPFKRPPRNLVILTSLCLAAVFTGALRANAGLSRTDTSILADYSGRSVSIKGMVAADAEIQDKNTRLRLEVSAIKPGQDWQAASGTVLATVPRYPAYDYGDVLVMTGKLETPASFADFDYRDYLARQGIYAVMYYPRLELVARDHGAPLLKGVYALRKSLAAALAQALPEPQAALAQGVVLGLRGNIPQPVKDDFTRSGTAHILAISGLNLGILAGILIAAATWLFGRRHYYYVWSTLAILWLYALLTGMQPPVVRSAIMASLFLLAELLGRQHSGLTALVFVAAMMAGISPEVLRDASFQLSFLAMAGLVCFYPTFRLAGRKAIQSTLGEEGAVVSLSNLTSDSLSATLAALLAVSPLIAYYFRRRFSDWPAGDSPRPAGIVRHYR